VCLLGNYNVKGVLCQSFDEINLSDILQMVSSKNASFKLGEMYKLNLNFVINGSICEETVRI
jgi:hypothetical protein